MTTAAQLEAALEVVDGDQQPKDRRFLGVFSADTLPPQGELKGSLNDGGCIIVNYDTAAEPGSHWCAMHLGGRRDGYRSQYFDSFGQAPDALDVAFKAQDPHHPHRTHFAQYLERWAGGRHRITFNRHELQGVHSSSCGDYAVVFCREGLPSTDNPVWRRLLAMPTHSSRDELAKEISGVKR